MLKNNPKHAARNGYVLVFFLLLTAVGLLLSTSLLALQGAVMRQTHNIIQRSKAGYLAEAGIDKGLEAYLVDQNYAGETFTLGEGAVTIALSPGATSNEKYVQSTGTVAGVSVRYRVKVGTNSEGIAVAFHYGIQVGAGGLTMNNNSRVNGNVYSNQNISGDNGSIINGDAAAVGTIGTPPTVTGTRSTGQAAQTMPPFDEAFWKTKAQEGGIINGDHSPASGSTVGPLYITGNLIFANSSNITLAGPIYIEGTITFGNSMTIAVSDSLGTNGAMIIAKQTASFGNTFTSNKNAGGGYLLIIALSNTTAISLGNSTEITNAPIYVPNGKLIIGNNARGTAFTAKELVLGNGSIVDYSQGLAFAGFGTGPGGGWQWQKGTFQEF